MALNSVRRQSLDIISKLPDEIIIQILSLIPTKDVVKTSILSKRWRSLWTSVDAVEITDFDLIYPAPSNLEKGEFMNFVDNVLNQAVFVRKLGLRCFNFYDMPRVKQWLDIVISKLDDYGALEELDLKFSATQLDDYGEFDLNFQATPFVELPPRIFNSKKLVILKLSSYMVINVPSSMAAWLPSLKVIHFNYVSILDYSSLENILAGCPVLEELSLRGFMKIELKKKRLCAKSSSLKNLTLHCYGEILNIEIEAPNLEELDVSFDMKNRIVISNLPLLKRLKYKIDNARVHHLDVFENTVMEFLRKTSNAKYLFVSIFVNYSFFLKVVPMFKNLMHLQLGIDIPYLPFLRSLLKITPNLVSFVLRNHGFQTELEVQTEQWCTPDNNGLMLEFLEKFEFHNFEGSDEEMDLVTYILKNAPVLKKMNIIFFCGKVAARLHSRIVELPKASMACQFHIGSTY